MLKNVTGLHHWFCLFSPANADGIEIAAVDFDRETLKSLGVDPNISHYFSRSARFLPGEYSLIVSVNGEKRQHCYAL
ncbi:hypothetical protein K7G95_07470 [Escherichia coli]|nr:hypothetical protein K7G95_07470 [Escherichia coli]